MLFEAALTPSFYGLRRDADRLFGDVLSKSIQTTAWVPAVDVREDQGELLVSVELPGIAPGQVEVTTDSGILTIRGEKRQERKEGDEGRYHLMERSYGSFTRSFRLPKGIDESKISATFRHGVLRVHIPKAALPQPKKIAITSVASEDGQREEPAVGGVPSSVGRGEDTPELVERPG